MATIYLNVEGDAEERLATIDESLGDLGDTAEVVAEQLDQVHEADTKFDSLATRVANAAKEVNTFVDSTHESITSMRAANAEAQHHVTMFDKIRFAAREAGQGLLSPIEGLHYLKEDLLMMPVVGTATVGTLVRLRQATRDHAEETDNAAVKQAVLERSTVSLMTRLSVSAATYAGVALGVRTFIGAGSAAAETARQIEEANRDSASSFEQLKGAAAGAALPLLRPFEEVGPAARGFIELIRGQLNPALNDFGQTAYERLGLKAATDYGVTNLKSWASFFESWVDQARSNYVKLEQSAVKALGFAGDNQKLVDGYADEAAKLRDLAKYHQDLDAKREKEKEHFAALRAANGDIERRNQLVQEAAQIQLMATTEAIDAAIQKEKEWAGQQAAAHTFAGENAEAYSRRIESLAKRRTEVIKEQEKIAVDATREAARKKTEAEQERGRQIEAEYKAQQKQLDEEQKRVQALEAEDDQHRINLKHDGNVRQIQDELHRLEQIEGAEQEAHARRMDLIREETARRVELATDDLSRKRAANEGARRLADAEANFNRTSLDKQVADAKKAAAEKMKLLQEGITKATGVTGQSMLAKVDNRAVLKRIQDQRAEAAGNKVYEDNAGLAKQAMVDPRAKRRLEEMQRRAENQARAGAFRDANQGKIGAAEENQARNEVGQAQLKAMNQSGKLATDTTQALSQMLQAAAENQATTAALQQQVALLTNQAKAVAGNSKQTRQRAQQNSL